MMRPDALDLERVTAEVLAAVERLLREGRTGRIEVSVNGPMRSVSSPVVLTADRPAPTESDSLSASAHTSP